MNHSTLIKLCEDYLALLHEDGFGDAILISKHALESNTLSDTLFTKTCADATLEQVKTASTHTALLCFWYCYCLARHKIETSYEYKTAEDTLFTANKILKHLLQSKTLQDNEKILLKLLSEWGLIFIANAQIDRSIYNGIPELLADASQALLEQINNIHQLAASLSEHADIDTLYTTYIKEQVECYRIYALTLNKASQLYKLRWQNPLDHLHKLQTIKKTFNEAAKELEHHASDDARIVLSDLMAHLPVLEKLARLRTPQQGVLFVRNAQLEIHFFAAFDHNGLDWFTQHIDNHCDPNKADTCLDLSSIGALGPVQEEMTDIWSGLASKNYITKYHWQLPNTQVAFRHSHLNFNTSLHYYRMGVFCLSFRSDIHNMDITEIRHAMGLGAPFALDENILFHGQEHGLLRDIADKIFENINQAVETYPSTSAPGKLAWNSKENWFASLDINELNENINNSLRPISLNAAAQHPTFSGLVLPLKEVRVGIDNWVNSVTVNPQDNIAPLRYDNNEFMYVQRHTAVTGLLSHPSWVKEQARESLLVATLITNLLLISNKRLSLSIKNIKPLSNNNEISLENLEAQIARLTQYEERLGMLLETIKLGTIVTYADHCRLMNGIFEHMDFDKLTANTRSVMQSVNQKHQHVAEKLDIAYEKEHERSEKRRDYIIAGAALLISIGAFRDFFDIFQIEQTVREETTIYALCAMLLIIVTLWFWRSKK